MSPSTTPSQGTRWFYADANNQSVGPLSEPELRSRYQSGGVQPDTLVIPETGGDWKSYREVFGVETAITHAPPLPVRRVTQQRETISCPFCTEEIPAAAKKCKHCGETVDVALRAAEEAKRSQSGNQPMVFMNAAGGAAAPVEKARFPHMMHLILSVFTGGIWIVFWLLHYLFRDRKRYG